VHWPRLMRGVLAWFTRGFFSVKMDFGLQLAFTIMTGMISVFVLLGILRRRESRCVATRLDPACREGATALVDELISFVAEHTESSESA
jgi:hypothetical protein